MTLLMRPMASWTEVLSPWMAPIRAWMSAVAPAVCLARSLTSLATTLNPRPAAPARSRCPWHNRSPWRRGLSCGSPRQVRSDGTGAARRSPRRCKGALRGAWLPRRRTAAASSSDPRCRGHPARRSAQRSRSGAATPAARRDKRQSRKTRCNRGRASRQSRPRYSARARA